MFDSFFKFAAGFISAHPWWTIGLIIGGWVISNATAALPSPNSAPGTLSSPGYKWFFGFSTGVVGALPRLFPFLRLPSDPTRNTPTYFNKPDDADSAPKSTEVIKP